MKSPFPGMDPYIEESRLWGDFQFGLIGEIHRAIAEASPERYVVRLANREYVVVSYEREPEARPDGPHFETAFRRRSLVEHTDLKRVTSETEAVGMRAFIEDRIKETFIEVYDSEPEERLVTCIEVLSPSNKRPGTEGWELYLRKRQALLLGAANFVEIDLLRGGQKRPMLDPWPQAPYTLLVCRQRRAPYCKVWPAHYRRTLPPIPVPLSSPDPDVSLSLQPMVEAVYARSRYYRSIDYGKPLTPPLGEDEQKWLAELLRARQARA